MGGGTGRAFYFPGRWVSGESSRCGKDDQNVELGEHKVRESRDVF